MPLKKHRFTSLIQTFTCAVLALGAIAQAQAEEKKAEPTGTWTWVLPPGPNGGPGRTNTLKLKLEDAKLAGKVSAPGRDGQTIETSITDVKLDNDTLSFAVIREFNGNSRTNKYSGKIAGDKIVGKVESMRNGEAQSRDWEAVREKK